MLNLLYFAWVRERMGKSAEAIPLPPDVSTVGALATYLHARDPQGRTTFADPTLIRAAINQDFASPEAPISDGDEIAFFPPVTGG